MDNAFKYEIKQKSELEKARSALQILKAKKAQNSSRALPIYMQNSHILKNFANDFNHNKNHNTLNQRVEINDIYNLKQQSSFQNNHLNSSNTSLDSNINSLSYSQLQNLRNHNISISAMSKFPPQFYHNTYSNDNGSLGNGHYGSIGSIGSIGSNEGIGENKAQRDSKDSKISNLAKLGQNSIKNISAY